MFIATYPSKRKACQTKEQRGSRCSSRTSLEDKSHSDDVMVALKWASMKRQGVIEGEMVRGADEKCQIAFVFYLLD